MKLRYSSVRHLVLIAGAVVLLLSACQPPPNNNVFRDAGTPTPATVETAGPPAQLDRAALSALRDRLALALSSHIAQGHLQMSWGGGQQYALAGPYRDDQRTVDALALEAMQAMTAAPTSMELKPLLDQAKGLTTGVANEFRDLSGPQGAALLAFLESEQLLPGPQQPVVCASSDSSGECLAQQAGQNLFKAWYASDTNSFLQVGTTSTTYRPVEALSTAAALIVSGFREREVQNPQSPRGKVDAGESIVRKEMGQDFDDQYAMVYGTVTSTPHSHSVTDNNTFLADQAGVAEVLLEAFDPSREENLREDVARVLQPLLDEKVPLRNSTGFVRGFDLRGSGPAADAAADVEAGLLVLQAARHYDRLGGHRFARLEEKGAQSVLAAAGAASGGSDGLPGALLQRRSGQAFVAGTPSAHSGLVTALGVVVLSQVLADIEASPRPSS